MPDLRGQPGWIPRLQAERLRERLEQFPAVALLGPRQVGKTSLALQLAAALTASARAFTRPAPTSSPSAASW
jgi:predicted AAA+ superfamily ATPase